MTKSGVKQSPTMSQGFLFLYLALSNNKEQQRKHKPIVNKGRGIASALNPHANHAKELRRYRLITGRQLTEEPIFSYD